MSPKIAILKHIAAYDGRCGWYQLDRALSMQGLAGVRVPSVLAELVADGLVLCEGDPNAAASHYRITQVGRDRLTVEG